MEGSIDVVVLTIFVVALSFLVLVVRRLLNPSSDIEIVINDSQKLIVPAGGKLLHALAENGIVLPAACGGRGSCGQCRLRVLSGGGEAVLTEKAQVSARDLGDHWRLACMVSLRGDLAVSLPETSLKARQISATVKTKQFVSTFMCEVVLVLDDTEAFEYVPGGYVLLSAPPGRTQFSSFDVGDDYVHEWRSNKLLDLECVREQTETRAYSIASYPLEAGVVKLVVRIALPPPSAKKDVQPGKVSSFIFGLQPGDSVAISGPFGAFRVHESHRDMVFIGGGAGIAPFRAMIFDQLLRVGTKRKMVFFYGARSRRDVCYADEFQELAERFSNFDWHVALSERRDNEKWDGPVGLIHNVVYDDYINRTPRPEESEYYVCGPPVMNSAVLAMLEDIGVHRDQIFMDAFE